MKLAALYLSRVLLLALCLGIAACVAPSAPSPLAGVAKPERKKDYSALRIGGRQEVELPGIGIIHADKREDASGDEIVFSGRVFLKLSLPTGAMLMLGEAQYAYAEKARWNSSTGVLCLEGFSIIEFDRSVAESTEAATRVFVDRSGKIITQGAHRHSFY